MSGNDMTRTVALASERAGWGRGLVASLPRALRLVRGDGEAADILLIDGAGEWVVRAARVLAQGGRQLVVVEPGPVDPAALAGLADAVDRAGADVALIEALPDNPALAAFRDRLDPGFGELVLDGADDEGIQGLLLTQLRLLRALGFRDLRLTAAAATSTAYLIDGEGRLNEAVRRLRLTGAAGARPARIEITAYADTAMARLWWSGGTEARPVEVMLADAAGLLQLPAIHEGGHRHGLRAMLALPETSRGSAPLRALADDAALLRSLLDPI